MRQKLRRKRDGRLVVKSGASLGPLSLLFLSPLFLDPNQQHPSPQTRPAAHHAREGGCWDKRLENKGDSLPGKKQ